MKKWMQCIALTAILVLTTACQNTSAVVGKTNVVGVDDIIAKEELKAVGGNQAVGYQLEPPAVGEEIAVITTNMGALKLRFFPEAAPKAVYNFKKLATTGYYNGLTFHRVIANFMVQGGDPVGNGTGGESIWGGAFEDEFSTKLFNITGSVAMANSGANTNGSQFFINKTQPTAVSMSQLQMIYDDYYLPNKDGFNARYGGTVDMSKMNDSIAKLYEANGGNMHLDGALSTTQKGHTVFAQVFAGMDVVEAMSQVKTNQSNTPAQPLIMEKIEIMIYEGE